MKRTISLAVFLVMLLPAAIASGAAGEETRSAIAGLSGSGTESDPYRIGSYNDLMIVSSYHSYHNGAHYIQTNDIIFDDIVNGNIITMIVSMINDMVIIELIPDVSGDIGDAIACVSLNDSVIQADWNNGFANAVFDASVLRSKNSAVAAGSFEGNDFAVAMTFPEIDGTITITAPLKGNFEPIGSKEDPFTGLYDGNGYSIKGIKVVSVGSDEVTAGLFGYTESAILCNIHIDSDAEHTSYVISSSIHDLKNSGTEGRLTLSSGGMVGVADGTTIAASSVNCSVSSFLVLISENENGPGISTLTVNIDVTSVLYTGGLIGYGNASVHDSMNTGAVSSLTFLSSRTEYIERDTDHKIDLELYSNVYSYSGGIVGYSGRSITITNTGNTAPVYSSHVSSTEIAGTLDILPYGVCSLSLNLRSVTVIGGVAGMVDTGDLTNTFNSGDLCVKRSSPFREPGYELEHFGNEYVYIGGSVGIVDRRLNIDHSHNVGRMYADIKPGYFDNGQVTSFGDDEYRAHVGDFYYLDTVFSGQYTDKNIVKLSASEMSSADTFAGWDFDRLWVMSDLGYPVLLIRYPLMIVDMSYPFEGVPKYFIDLDHKLDDDGVLSAYTGRSGFTFTLADEYNDSDVLIYALHGERMIVLEADSEGRYRIPSPLLMDTSGITLYADGIIKNVIIPDEIVWDLISIPEGLDETVILVIVSIAVVAAAVTIINIISAASVLSMSAKAEADMRKEERE